MIVYYNFFKDLWILNRLTEEYLRGQVAKNRLTEQEYQDIINTPKGVA